MRQVAPEDVDVRSGREVLIQSNVPLGDRVEPERIAATERHSVLRHQFLLWQTQPVDAARQQTAGF